MKQLLSKPNLAHMVAALIAIIIALVPFHAFLTVWSSSLVGHYTALRLWKEALLLMAGGLVFILLWRSPALWRTIYRSWLWRLIGLFAAVTLLWGLVAHLSGAVTTKAVWYGMLLDIRPFAMLLIAFVAASLVSWLYRCWQRLVLWPAAGVVAIGLLQYFVLPHDVMKHFGYGPDTISPYATIDHKPEYIRIRSTLRGPNLLGGYLLIILPVLAGLWQYRRRWLIGAAVFATLVCLYASGSRGAWLGAIAAGLAWAWLRLPSRQARRKVLLGCMAVALVAGTVIVLLRHNDFVQNVVFHTDEHSTSSESSNAAHLDAKLDAAIEVLQEPLGRGPGTAGPAGFYNTGHPVRLAENNFLQVGQETGWIGLGLFTAIFVLLGRALWQRRQLALAQVLLASLAGLTVMAMIMHAWTDDTIVYLWFGLAGLALAQPHKKRA